MDLVRQARWLASVYDDVGEMVRIGAYRTGANEEVDRAVAFHPLLEGFLAQDSAQFADLDDAFDGIAKILSDQEISEE
ncbi:MAG: hypothetical protein R3C40_09295 [Parvularculaceae bacterium]